MTATLKITNLQNESSVTPNIVLNADGTTTIPTQSTTNLAYTGTLTGGTGVIAIGTNQIYKDASGNVGIGTALPGAKLHVTSGNILLGSGTNGTAPSFSVDGGTDGANGPSIFGKGNGSNEWLVCSQRGIVGGAATGMADYVYGNNPRTFWTSNAERMRITGTGDVGIGTGNPSAQFEVYNASVARVRVNSNTSTSDFAQSGTTLYVSNNSNGPMLLQTNSAERMRITSAGDIGIGTSSPSYQLNTSKAAGIGDAGQLVRFTNTSVGNSLGPLHLTIGTANYFAEKPGMVLASTNSLGFAIGDGSDLANQRKMMLDTSGNLGLGVTPSAWGSGIKALDVNTVGGFVASTGSTISTLNCYFNAGWKYKTTGTATYYDQTLGTHAWYTAPSGTAGNAISFTQAMTLDASGNLGVGETIPANFGRFVVTGNPANGPQMSVNSSTGQALLNFYEGSSGRFGLHTLNGSAGLSFYDTFNGAERARIDSSGNLKIGTTTEPGRLSVVTPNTSSGEWGCLMKNSAGSIMFAFLNNGQFYTGGASGSPYNNTTGASANLVVGADSGILQRSTSSLRYKTDVQNATHGLADVMNLRPVTYKGKNDGDTVFGGLIAEEVDEAGLTEFVVYDADGNPDALHYGNMVSLAFKAIQEQQSIITQLQADVAALKGAA